MTTDRTAVAYVAGWGRSGSTILAELLAHRPGAVHVGELRFLWRRGIELNQRCGCGEPFLDCPFWSEVGAAVGGWSPELAARMIAWEQRFQRNKRIRWMLSPGAADDSDFADYRRTLAGVYAAIRSVGDAPLIVDSSKDVPYRVLLATVPSLDLRTIHLVRDSRAAAFSWASPKNRPELADGELMPKKAAVRASREYDVAHLLHDYVSRRVPGTTRVRYEDFAADSGRTITGLWRDIADVAGPVDPSAAEHMYSSQVSHTVSGNPIRFDRGPIVIKLDARWRQELPPSDRRKITALTLPLLLRYGYLPERAPQASTSATSPAAP